MVKIRRLDKLPRRKLTIGDILNSDTLVGMIKDLEAERADIDEFVILYSKKNDDHFYFMANGCPESRIIYMCEAIKHSLLNEE